MTLSPFFARSLNKLGLLPMLNIYTRGSNGVKIPLLREVGVQNIRLTEPWMSQVLTRLKPLFKGQFVDIGVNLGQTLIKTQTIFKEFSYIGFEPNSTCVHYVEDLIRVNRFRDCMLVPVGVSRDTEILKLNFYYEDEADPCASIVEEFRPEQRINHFKFVPVFNIDLIEKFLPATQNTFLKIDVEGAELEVIAGLQSWIRQYQPVILMEILPVYKKENQFRLTRQIEMENIFKSMQYRIFRILKKNIVEIEAIDSIGVHDVLDNSDYIVCSSAIADSVVNAFK